MLGPIAGTEFTVRRFSPDDRSFVISSWLMSHRSSFYAKDIGPAEYFKAHAQRLEQYVEQMPHNILCVVVSDVPDAVVAWVAGVVGSHVDYVYVKKSARLLGLGSYLMKNMDAKYRSHETRRTGDFFAKFDVRLDPYLFKTAELAHE